MTTLLKTPKYLPTCSGNWYFLFLKMTFFLLFIFLSYTPISHLNVLKFFHPCEFYFEQDGNWIPLNIINNHEQGSSNTEELGRVLEVQGGRDSVSRDTQAWATCHCATLSSPYWPQRRSFLCSFPKHGTQGCTPALAPWSTTNAQWRHEADTVNTAECQGLRSSWGTEHAPGL